jgi:Lar family restriction alleviation protein
MKTKDPAPMAPCPFCGATPTQRTGRLAAVRLAEWKSGWGSFEFTAYAVSCARCDAYGPRRKTKHGAIAAWNRRPNPPH